LNRRIDIDKIGFLRRKKRRRRILIIAVLSVLLLSGVVFAVSRTGFLRALLAPVSFVARLVNPIELKEEEGRINVLVLGLDTRGGTGLMNTDTILVGSFSVLEGEPAMVSIPRDFWMNLSPYGYGRINAAYSRGGTQKDGSFDEEAGVAFAGAKIEEILGIKIPYWVVVDFEGFEQIIGTLGGVEICVEKTFDDYSYPVPGREAAHPVSSRYEHLHFDAGCQAMDGPTALKYARSRSGTNGEGSDFARARRQQKVILAVKDKVFSLDLLLNPAKLATLFDQVTKTVRTNASFGEVQRGLEIAAKLGDLSAVESLVLDPDSGLVYHPANAAPYGGAYVIVPKVSGYAKIHEAIRNLLYAPKDVQGVQGQ